MCIIFVHSSQQREERTKKRRRCYRAEAVAGSAVVGGCGTRPVPSSRLALSLPGKGGVLRLFYLFPIYAPLRHFSHSFLP